MNEVNIFIRVKAAGKRRDILEKRPLALPAELATVEDLIACIVRQNVRAFNAQKAETPEDSSANRYSSGVFFPALTEREYADGLSLGKVGFGAKYNDAVQDEEKAVTNALQCFADGLYKALLNETELKPGDALCLHDGDVLTFIRLVMLAGGYWRWR